jgi:osmotically inducible lipoprotein OsmB
MKTMLKLAPVAVVLALAAGCGTTVEQRAASGAIGGAVVGQAVGRDTGSTVAGAAIGAVAGAATTPPRRRPN